MEKVNDRRGVWWVILFLLLFASTVARARHEAKLNQIIQLLESQQEVQKERKE